MKQIRRNCHSIAMTAGNDLAGLSDTALLRRARRDPDAFGEFYDRHVRRLYSSLLRDLADPDAALDLTAETFAQALLSIGRFRGRHEESGSAWLYAIARNLVLRHRAGANRERRACERLQIELARGDVEAAPSSQGGGPLLGSLRRALRLIPPDQRRAIELRVVREQTYDDVASDLGCTAVAARIRVSRGLRTLQHLMRGET